MKKLTVFLFSFLTFVGNAFAQLGDTTKDLVFTPVTPCRIVDTRNAGGQLAANSTRNFDITAVSSYAFQGGDSTNCGGAGAAGSFAAALLNVTVVSTTPGFLTIFPFLAAQPLASSLNFGANDIRGNSSVFRLDQGASTNELSVFTTGQTHLIIDIMGYFKEPQAALLSCSETFSGNVTINANSTNTGSAPSCPAGEVIVGGGCTSSTFDGRVVSSRQFPNSNTQFCAWRNESVSSPMIGVAYGRCCKFP
jgi:hypothetical protein